MMKKFGIIVSVFFLLIFLEVVIMELKKEVSLIRMLEIGSVALVIILYYSIVRTEVRIASKVMREALMRVEKKFEDVEKRFERVEKSFDEDVRTLKKEVYELKHLLKKDARKLVK